MKSLPLWIYRNLYHYNNCLIDRSILKKLGIEGLKDQIESCGFSGVIINEINSNVIVEISGIDKKIFKKIFEHIE